MNACVSVVCYKSKTLSNGENPLMLQVSKGGKRKYQSLGISINPKYWDFTRNKPKPNCPNKEYIQKIILDKQRELQQRMLELNSEQKEYTTTTLLNNENTKFELKTVSMFYKESILRLDSFRSTLSKILCKWKQDSVVSLFLYLNSVFKHKHKLIHNQAPV